MSLRPFAPRLLRTRTYRTAVAVVTVLLMLALAACSPAESEGGAGASEGGGAASEGGGGESDSVVFGTVPIAGTAAVHVTQQAGYFEEANIDVEIANAAQFEDIVPNVVNGTYTFGTISVGTVASAINQNLPIQIVANTYHFNGEQQLMASSDGDIETIEDLRGTTIGLGGLNNNFHAGIVAQMEEAGVSRDEVEFTLIPPPEIPGALRNGTIDAGQINEPFITSEGDAFRPIIPEPFAPFGENACNNYVIVNSQWAQDNPELLERFLEAYNRGAELAASDPDKVVEAVASYTEIEPEVLAQMNMPGFGSDLKKDSFEATVQGMLELGFLEEEVTVEQAFYDEST
jgi:ABC-type nitrate/sulfonate/bicarbonate transport system substrate-binding protein